MEKRFRYKIAGLSCFEQDWTHSGGRHNHTLNLGGLTIYLVDSMVEYYTWKIFFMLFLLLVCVCVEREKMLGMAVDDTNMENYNTAEL